MKSLYLLKAHGLQEAPQGARGEKGIAPVSPQGPSARTHPSLGIFGNNPKSQHSPRHLKLRAQTELTFGDKLLPPLTVPHITFWIQY